MKKTNLDIYRSIVGYETGFTGEGTEQWFYTLSLAINLMLVWWLNPKIAMVFTVLAVIHYLTVFVYGFLGLDCMGSPIFACAYYAIHLVIIIVAFLTNFKWAIITASITIIAYLFAPDCTETSIIPGRNIETRENLALKHNTMILVAFAIIDFLLPIKL